MNSSPQTIQELSSIFNHNNIKKIVLLLLYKLNRFWNVNQEECIEEREIVPPENEQFQKMSVEDEEDNDTQCLVLKMNDEIFLTSYNNSVQIWSYESKI